MTGTTLKHGIKLLGPAHLCSGEFCLEFPHSSLNTNHKSTVEGSDDSILHPYTF